MKCTPSHLSALWTFGWSLRVVISSCSASVAHAAEGAINFGAASVSYSAGSTSSLTATDTLWGAGTRYSYELQEKGWVNASTPLRNGSLSAPPITFLLRVDRPCQLELKFNYAHGSVFGCRLAIETEPDAWSRLTIFPRDAEYWWGGEKLRGQLVSFDLAVSGKAGAGTISIARMERGDQDLPSSFGLPSKSKSPLTNPDVPLLRAPYHGPLIDPASEMPGFGSKQRRAPKMIPEDPLVMKWLMLVQDAGSAEQKLLPSALSSDEAHTFNNALVTMAFLRHDQRQRAERILDFFQQAALNRDNADPLLQSFYFNGEPRGFFQRVSLRGENGATPYHAPPDADR